MVSNKSRYFPKALRRALQGELRKHVTHKFSEVFDSRSSLVNSRVRETKESPTSMIYSLGLH